MTNQISLEHFLNLKRKSIQAGKSVVVFNFIEPWSVFLKKILVQSLNFKTSLVSSSKPVLPI